MAIVKLVIAFLLSITQILAPITAFTFHGGIKGFQENWNATDEFTRDYCTEIEKNPDKDFVILTLTDIQLSSDDIFAEAGEYTYALITKLINETKPDMIALVGDNCSSLVGYIELAKFFDSFQIPWAPVMGNHDGGNGETLHEAWDSYILTDSEYCLFKFGPQDMGYGNYIINITENGQIIHSLFMMDSHSSAEDTEASKINIGINEDGTDIIGYDHFWANQLQWYEWAVKGIQTVAGKTVESTVFMHIPVCEYWDAQEAYCVNVTSDTNDYHYQLKDEYADLGFGSNDEGICAPEGNNGFFALCKELGSTTHMIAGHDHKNDSSILYNGIRLSYCEKSGHGSYYNEKQGGSVLTIHSDGSYQYAHYPVDAASVVVE